MVNGNLPEGWSWTTIGEVTLPIEKTNPNEKPTTPFTYLDISSIDNTSQTIVEPKEYLGREAPSRARQLVKASDVLFSTVRTYLKNIAFVPDIYDGQIASTGFSVLRANKTVYPKYLFYYSLTDSFLEPLNELQRGTSYPAVRDGDVRNQPFPRAPLPEQERIVLKIEELFTQLDAGVAALKRVQAGLKWYKASILYDAFNGRLIKNPDEWNWVKLGNITRVLRGASPRPKGDPKYYGGNIPWIKISDVTSEQGKYLSSTVDTVNEQGAFKSRYLQSGSLILSICATVCVPKILKIDGCIHDGFVYFPDLPDDINLTFLYYYFESIRNKVIQENRQGMTQVNLNTGIVSNFQFPYISQPLQECIVTELERQLSSASDLEVIIDTALKRSSRLRQSILKRAFEGTLA